MKTLYAGHKKYEGNILMCSNNFEQSYTPKSIEANKLLVSLAATVKNALDSNKTMNFAVIGQKKTEAEKIIKNIDGLRNFMDKLKSAQRIR